MNPGQEMDHLGANNSASVNTNGQSMMVDQMNGNPNSGGVVTSTNGLLTNQVVPSKQSNNLMQPFMSSSRNKTH
jgi:hypothetical protein